MYPPIFETLFNNSSALSNNNSIKPVKLKALADIIQDISPGLVDILASFDDSMTINIK